MRSSIIGTLAAVALAAACSAQTDDAAAPDEGAPSGAYVLDTTHASVSWKIWHFGLSHYTGRFDTISADLTYNAEYPSQSALSVSIDPTSVNVNYTGEAEFQTEVAEDPRFLNGVEFPAISFVATSIDVTGDSSGTITGDLTLVGQTHPVTLDVTLNANYAVRPYSSSAAIGFSATGTILRSDFGMAWGTPAVLSDEVTIEIQAEFHPAP